MRGLFAASLVALSIGLTGCGDRPQVLPQGTVEQQLADVRERILLVLSSLASGNGRDLVQQEAVFLPSRWRRHAQQLQEIAALEEALKGRDGFVLGDLQVRGRWALVDGVRVDGEPVGPAELPWFMVYYAGEWRWLPSSILKDPAVTGMMDSSFDRLFAEWRAGRTGS
ncbi:MAG TPA: hypothetical protein ENO16_01550 [Chromatiales bacterium]|nr:hypothetical protein [Chromatiales bacterium]